MKLMHSDKLAPNFMFISMMGATLSIGLVQQIVSLISGIIAIGSGVFAIRYYYIKAKIK